MAALNSFAQIRVAVDQTSNETFQREGRRVLESLEAGDKVDAGALTLTESRELGERLLREGAGGLQGLIDECQRIGETIERLPRPPSG